MRKKIKNMIERLFINRIHQLLQSENEKNNKDVVSKIKNEFFYDNLANSTEVQLSIKNQYRLLKSLPDIELPKLEDCGFQVYSQYEEDGILLYLFSIIGVTNKKVVEICAGDGSQCMASNLIINHGWDGLLFDGDKRNVEKGKDFFKKNAFTFLMPPKFVHSWITVENVNKIIGENEFKGEIDLLSLDIDGNDYWILKELEVVKPRIIVCETQDIIPSNLSLTIPYKPDFYYNNLPENQKDFRSVSLLAMKKLCKQKGYRLIGAHRYGFNVFFMREDIAPDIFPEVSVESIHNNPWTEYGQKKRWPKVKDLNWEQV